MSMSMPLPTAPAAPDFARVLGKLRAAQRSLAAARDDAAAEKAINAEHDARGSLFDIVEERLGDVPGAIQMPDGGLVVVIRDPESDHEDRGFIVDVIEPARIARA